MGFFFSRSLLCEKYGRASVGLRATALPLCLLRLVFFFCLFVLMVAFWLDGQVTMGSMVLKPSARKVRKLGPGIVCGFAGATAEYVVVCSHRSRWVLF